MLKRFLLLGSVMSLSSCGYVIDQQIQDITVVTPGAENAMCYVYVDDLRYKLYAPQTTSISKSHKDLTVDCLAPGNRRRKVVIEPILSEHEYLNVANGVVPGAAWDLASNSMFSYPEVITVDFTGSQITPEQLPQHNNPQIKQPEEYDLEEFTSKLPRLNSDRGAVSMPLQRRAVRPTEESEFVDKPSITSPTPVRDKGDLQSVVDGLTTSSTPRDVVAPSTGTSVPLGAPVTINPNPAPVAAPTVSTTTTTTQTPAATTSTTTTTTPAGTTSSTTVTPPASAGPSKPEQAGPPIPLYPGQ